MWPEISFQPFAIVSGHCYSFQPKAAENCQKSGSKLITGRP
jgi:hypothetical protein